MSLKELVGERCVCTFMGAYNEWPLAGPMPARVTVVEVDLPLIAVHYPPYPGAVWINAATIKTLVIEPKEGT